MKFDNQLIFEAYKKVINEGEQEHPVLGVFKELFSVNPLSSEHSNITESVERINPVTQTPAFKAWFKNSVVVDKEGQPLICYHVSGTDFNEFRPLSHFGTSGQARSLYYGRANKLGDPKLLKQTYPVYLSIQKPLRIEDKLTNDIYSLLQQVNKNLAAQYMEELHEYNDKISREAEKKDEVKYNVEVKAWRKHHIGAFPQKKYEHMDIAGRDFLYFRDNQHPARWKDKLIDEIKRQGYDGLVYLNRYESNNPERDSKQPIPTQFAPKEAEMVDSYIVLDPRQVKSASGNKGTYNMENPNITESVQRTNPITQTPAFKAWFKNSKCVDEQGNPLPVFHGTKENIQTFKTEYELVNRKLSKTWLGNLGAWFSGESKHKGNYDPENAEYVAGSFTENPKGRSFCDDEYYPGAAIYITYLSIQNPYEAESFEELLDARDEEGSNLKLRETFIKMGHDGIVIRNCDTDGFVDRDDWVAFYPQQIKSVYGNKGTFNPEHTDITESNNLVKLAYHGTDNIATQSIKKNGLRVSLYDKKAFLTNSKKSAQRYAKIRASENKNLKPEIIVVDVNAANLKEYTTNGGEIFYTSNKTIAPKYILNNITESVITNLDPYKVALYELILKSKPTSSVAVRHSLQDQIANVTTLEKLEEIAGLHKLWSQFKQYINFHQKTLNT